MTQPLTSSVLLSAVSGVMEQSGYRNAYRPGMKHLDQVWEDEYGVVAVAIYHSWDQLTRCWPDAQGELVELLTQELNRTDPKAWEGYVVLITPEIIDTRDDVSRELATIRNNVQRARKLVITGAEVPTISAVWNALLPVLPLPPQQSEGPQHGLLQVLPRVLSEEHQVPESITRAVIAAFLENESLIDAIEKALGGT